MNIDELRVRFQRAKTRRSNWESMWEDCIDYAMPARQGFYDLTPGQERTDRVYDETAIIATAEFASRMQSSIMPPGRKWFRLTVSDVVPEDQRTRMQADLDKITDYIHLRIIQSNFDAEIHECFMDIAIGTCALSIDLDSLNRLIFKAAPLPTIWIDEGPDGRVASVFRMRVGQTVEMIEAKYGKAPPRQGNDVNLEYTVYEGLIRDYDRNDDEVYIYRIWVDCLEEFLVSEEYVGQGSAPMICARWAETADEWYGRGPLINLLPCIRSANLTRELIFENAEMAISGMWQYPNDGTINPAQIEIAPHTFIPKAPGSTGLEPLVPPGRFDVAKEQLDDLRFTIKRGLYSEEYTPTGRTPLSAMEISARQTDLAARIGSPFARLLKELVQPIILRIVYLYTKAGMIDMPKIDGRIVQVVPVSPLARAGNAETIQRMTAFIGTLVQIMGPQATGTFIRTEPTVAMLAELYEYPAGLLHDNATRQKEAKQSQELAKLLQGAVQTVPGGMPSAEQGPMQGQMQMPQ